MSLYRKIFDSVKGDIISSAQVLYSAGKYKECIIFLNDSSPVDDDNSTWGFIKSYARIMVEPKSIDLERAWMRANCNYHLGEFNACLSDIKYLMNYPKDDSETKHYKELASNLQSMVLKQMENLSELEVRYPQKTFTEIFTEVDSTNQEERFEVKYEGLQKTDGAFYIKASSIKANSKTRLTIYVSPISKAEVIIFGYLNEIDKLNKLKDDDPIKYHATKTKLSLLKELEKEGKDGAIEKCTVFETIDWAKPSGELLTPVIGLRCSADINTKKIEDLFEIGVRNVVETANIILNELRNNKLTTSDKLLMYGKAFTIGALSTVISKELGRDFAKAFKEVSNAVFRKS